MGTIPTLLVVAVGVGLLRGVLLENRQRRRDPHALRYPNASRYLLLHSVLLVCAGAFLVRAVLWDLLTSPAANLLAAVFVMATTVVDRLRTHAELAHRR